MELQASVLALLLLSATHSPLTSADSACPDEYMYTEQPPADTVCSPYINNVLKLKCAITGPNLEQIHWFFSETIDSEEKLLLTNSTKYTLITMFQEDGLALALTVHSLNAENDTGVYWCQASIAGSNSLLSASNYFTLEDDYGETFQCPQNFLRNSEILCASPLEVEPPSEDSTTSSPVSPTQTHPPSSSSSSSLSSGWE